MIVWITIFLLQPSLSVQRGTWNASGNYEYYVSEADIWKPYSKSSEYCNERGGRLALVKSKNIQEFIQTLVTDGSGTPYGFSIGLRDMFGNNTFTWDDGTALTYSNWLNSGAEPNHVNETCAAMGWTHSFLANLPWYDMKCQVRNGFVCQRGIETTPLVYIAIGGLGGAVISTTVVLLVVYLVRKKRSTKNENSNVETRNSETPFGEPEYATIADTNIEASHEGEYTNIGSTNPPYSEQSLHGRTQNHGKLSVKITNKANVKTGSNVEYVNILNSTKKTAKVSDNKYTVKPGTSKENPVIVNRNEQLQTQNKTKESEIIYMNTKKISHEIA